MGIYKLLANFTGAVRNDTMGGKNYLVAPMIMFLEGVHEGSQGAIYYPESEISKSAQVWNMKPIVLYHPEANGIGISACDPDVIENRGLGIIMNTRFEDGKLKAEAWLEVDRCNIIDKRIMGAIENNQIMELSTGLYSDFDTTEGIWNDEPYLGTAFNFRPDHLALLPDLKGACSVEDGAGFLRLNQSGTSIMCDQKKMTEEQKATFKNNSKNILNHLKAVLANEMSYDTIRSLLWTALDDTRNNAWIEDVFDDFFIFNDDGQLFKQNYLATDGKVDLVGDPEPVVRIIEYRTEAGSVIGNEKIIINRKDSMMDKKKMVDDLIANESTAWKEEHRKTLMAMEEDVLTNMIPIPIVNKTSVKKDEPKKVTVNVVKTLDEHIAELPKEMRGMVVNGIASYNADKKKLIEIILGNKSNTFTEDQLEQMEASQLQNIATLAASTKEQITEVSKTDYSGLTPVVNADNIVTEEPLPPPVMNFDLAEKEVVAAVA